MVKLTLELPQDAAERLINLLTSDSPEGQKAREDLGVVVCSTHKCPLVSYVIKGGIWLGEEQGFDTRPQHRVACPQCEQQ